MQKYVIPAPAPGVYKDVPDDDYHAWDAFSATQAKALSKGPANLRYMLDNPMESSASMVKGSICHTLCLQLDKMADYFAIMPDKMRRGTKAHKQWVADELKGRQEVSHSEYTAGQRMATALMEDIYTRKILERLDQRELSIVFENYGVLCKARLDGSIAKYDSTTALIIDIKTTISTNQYSFQNSCREYRYDLQAAHYLNAAKAIRHCPRRFMFLAVQNSPPWPVQRFEIHGESLMKAHDELRGIYATYKKCKETGDWTEPQDPEPTLIKV